MYPLLFIGILVVLSSCTPSARVARILKNHPELIKRDTAWVKDTVISQSARRDSTFFYNTKDSIIVMEGRLVMKYFYNSKDSTVYLRGECLPDTIMREIPIQVNSVRVTAANGIIQSLKDSIYNPVVWLLLILIALFILRK